jgi:hypothetical protein
LIFRLDVRTVRLRRAAAGEVLLRALQRLTPPQRAQRSAALVAGMKPLEPRSRCTPTLQGT